MFSNKKIMKFTDSYSGKIGNVKKLLNRADKILIGAGSGLSAAGGLDYCNPELVKKWFPEYIGMGLKTILDIQGMYWWLHRSKPEYYWGYWARHILYIRYQTGALQPYKSLFELIKDKDYFICSTNVDGQFEKAGFPKSKIFAPQGDYAFFQCSQPCSDDVYGNRKMIEEMVNNMHSPMEIRLGDIPKCPKCGAPLVPNLRCDNSFVEKPHIHNLTSYETFLEESLDQQLVLLELGVGYNTPLIIRYPFEAITNKYTNATLIRMNNTCAAVPKEIEDKSISLQEDILKVLHDL